MNERVGEMSVTHTITRELRIEKREVWVVSKTRPPLKDVDFPCGHTTYLVGPTWTENDEELYVCDSLEGAEQAMKLFADRPPWG